MKKIVLLSLVSSGILMAGGWRIPETSLNGVALSAANVAHNKSADAAYYNPANMVFMEDKNHIEMGMTYIGLDAPNYKGSHNSALTGATTGLNLNGEEENFFIPNLHYVSSDINGIRFGMSVVVPGGLTKRWNEQPAQESAQEFTLKIIEFAPSVAFKITDELSVAAGIRVIYSDGTVKSTGAGGIATRDLTGDSIDLGYNIALAYKPIKELELAATYRSNVDMAVKGNAKLSTVGAGGATYYGPGNVSIPLPALLNIAAAYTFSTGTTIEFVYERNYWRKYSSLDFDYDGSITNPILLAAFDAAKVKDWKDTNTFRLGITQELDKLTLMGGVVIDETPVPDATIGFELPDSDSVSVSLGGRYQLTEDVNVGLAALYSFREDRTVNNSSFVGEFSNTDVLMISAAIEYKF